MTIQFPSTGIPTAPLTFGKGKAASLLASTLLLLPAAAACSASHGGEAVASKAASKTPAAVQSGVDRVEGILKPYITRLQGQKPQDPLSEADVFCTNNSSTMTQTSHKVKTPQDPAQAAITALDACRAEGKLPKSNITVIDPEQPFISYAPPTTFAYKDSIATITPTGKLQEGQLLVNRDPATKQITSLNIGIYDVGANGMKDIGKKGRDKVSLFQFDDTNTIGFTNGSQEAINGSAKSLNTVKLGYFKPSPTKP